LGGHISACDSCKKEIISYNSCRNRHCPKCQVTNREQWIVDRESELLPVPYYHMVFTLPHCFNALLPKHAKAVYAALFKAAWLTIQAFAEDDKYLGAKPAMTTILHTWGQQLWLHPHLHCIVPGGGITKSGNWKMAKGNGKYLFPKRALSLVFRAKFMAELRKKLTLPYPIGKQAFKHKWVVYAKKPFASPKTVVEYLGRYSHKIALSNHRLTLVNHTSVSFSYKDYRQGAKQKLLTLSGIEFLRRFSLHILPAGFVRIRHYGFLASRNKALQLNIAKTELNQPKWVKVKYSWAQIAIEKLNYNPVQCPFCKKETLRVIKIIHPERGPPVNRFSHV